MYKICIIYLKMSNKKQEFEQKNFTITKKIAKHGSQAIIVVPRILEEKLKPGTIVEIKIDVLTEAKNE